MLDKPQNQTSISAILSQVATICMINSTTLGMSRIDKAASAESERAHNAKSGISKVSVSRLAGCEDRIKEIKDCIRDARDLVIYNTTPWGDRRLLNNINIEKLLRAYGPIKQSFDAKVKKLHEDAPMLIAAAETNKGNFNVEPPSLEEIQEAFSMELKLEAVPDASKFSASNLDAQIEEQLRRRFEADTAAAYQQAQQDALKRLAEPLEDLVRNITNYSRREDEKARGITSGPRTNFRDSIVDHVVNIANVFGSFNILNDPAIAALNQQLDEFRGLDIDALKKHGDLRDATAKKAQEILAKLGDWIN